MPVDWGSYESLVEPCPRQRDSRGRFVRTTPFTEVNDSSLTPVLRRASFRSALLLAVQDGTAHPLAWTVLDHADRLLDDSRRAARRNGVSPARENPITHFQVGLSGPMLGVFRNVGMPHGWSFERWDSYGEYIAVPRAHLAPTRQLDPSMFVYSTGDNHGRTARFAIHINEYIRQQNTYERENIIMPSATYVLNEETNILEFQCSQCNGQFPAQTEQTVPNEWPPIYVCQTCFDAQNTYCEQCDNYVPRYSMTSYAGEPMCDSCSEYRSDNEHGDPEDASHYVNSYSYRPRPLFTSWDGESAVRSDDSAGGFFMGIELEMEMHEARLDTMASIAVGANPEAVYLKSDGSINYGFEVVTHPHTLDAYKHGFQWSWMDELRRAGVRSWNDDNCGLHIHISNDAWGTSGHFARWWVFMRSNSAQWIKLAGRRSTYAKWNSNDDREAVAARAYKIKPADLTKSAPPAPRYDGSMTAAQIDRMEYERNFFVKYHPNQLAKKASANYERYSALNCQNQNTVELRFWRPSMRHTTVLAALEASHASVEFTRQTKYKGSANGALAWSEFTRWLSEREAEYPYANARIAVRFGQVADRDGDA